MYRKTCPANLMMRSNLTFDPSFKVKLGSTILKVSITCLLLVLEVLSVKSTYRKSCPANLLMMMSNLTLDPSFKVKLGSTTFKGPKTHLLLVLEVWDVKSTYRKTCPAYLLMM